MNKLDRRVWKSCFLAWSITFCLPCMTVRSFAEDKIIAVVNNEVITKKDLNDFISFLRMQLSTQFQGQELEEKIKAMKPDLLDKLIDDRLILQAAKKNDSQVEIQPNIRISIKPDQARIKARIDEIKSRYESDKDFRYALSLQGLTQTDIETKIYEQLLTYNMVEYKIKSKITVNPAEVTDFYEKNKPEFTTPEQLKLDVLETDNESTAGQLYEGLKNGREADELSKALSADLKTIFLEKNAELKKTIADAIYKLSPGQISEPVQVDNNYYVFKLLGIIAPQLKKLPEVQESITAVIFEKKMQKRLKDWMAELKEQSYIKIFDE